MTNLCDGSSHRNRCTHRIRIWVSPRPKINPHSVSADRLLTDDFGRSSKLNARPRILLCDTLGLINSPPHKGPLSDHAGQGQILATLLYSEPKTGCAVNICKRFGDGRCRTFEQPQEKTKCFNLLILNLFIQQQRLRDEDNFIF